MAAISQKLDAMTKKAKKNMALWDWALAKISLFILGILIVSIRPQLQYHYPWIMWFIIAAALMAIPLASIYKKPLLKKNQKKNTDSYPMKQFRLAKQNLSIIEWAAAKASIIFLGIGVCNLIPSIYVSFSPPVWAILWLITLAIPLYFVYDYTPQKKTPFSQMRANYTRSKLPMTESAEKRAVETFRGDQDGISRMYNWRRALYTFNPVQRARLLDMGYNEKNPKTQRYSRSKKTAKKRHGKKPGAIQLFPNRKK